MSKTWDPALAEKSMNMPANVDQETTSEIPPPPQMSGPSVAPKAPSHHQRPNHQPPN